MEQSPDWIRTHPGDVNKIVLRHRLFYEKYLSFQRNYEHFYELSFRMAFKKLDQEDPEYFVSSRIKSNQLSVPNLHPWHMKATRF